MATLIANYFHCQLMTPETRASLIMRLGDPADELAWSEFLEIYEPLLHRLAIRWGLQEADASEVAQETLIAVSKSIERFEPRNPGSFRSWLAKIARNKWVDLLNRKSKHAHATGDSNVQSWLGQQAEEETHESIWDWSEKQEIFAWAANHVQTQVSETTWQAFYKTAILQQQVKTVAKDLNMREGMVYVARSRVMSRLRKTVQTWCVGQSKDELQATREVES